jgi:hypothetical protein
VSEHLIEIWKAEGEHGTLCTAFCLTCNWMGGDGTRGEAETEAGMHERGERHPWQLAPGEAEAWKPGNPTMPSV